MPPAANTPSDAPEGSDPGAAEEYYVYPVVPGTDAWAQLDSLEKMMLACDIPRETVEKMSARQPARAVLDYPLLNNLFVYDVLAETPTDGAEQKTGRIFQSAPFGFSCGQMGI